jgi:hypothetical protein
MKKMTRLLFFLACISLAVSCSKTDTFFDDMSEDGLKSAQPIAVTVPFKCEIYTENTIEPYDMSNPEDPVFLLILEGTGIASHMGKMTYSGEVLVKPVSNVFWLKDPPGIVTLTAANGDELWISMGARIGTILPVDENDPPGYYSKFNIEVDVTGGTGRFEGATGTLSHPGYHVPPMSLASMLIFEGDLVLVRGNS